MTGLTCDQNTQNPVTLSITPLVGGLSARLTKYASPLQVVATTNVLTAYSGTGACQYVLEFIYNLVPTQGQTNTQLTVNFLQNTATQTGVTIASVSVTLNLNCAPQFKSISAFQVGQAPVIANTVTKTLGGSVPNNIQVVTTPQATSAATYTGAAEANVAPYMVQYVAEFGITGALSTGAVVNPPVVKTFVNCIGTLAAGVGTPTGVTVIGSVSVRIQALSELRNSKINSS